MERNSPCWCGSGKKWKKCHYPNVSDDKNFSDLAKEYYRKWRIQLKTPEQIAGIRAACLLTRDILKELCSNAKEGVTTESLDKLAYQLHMDAKAVPATLGYGSPPYPKSICTSLNDVICHGIPDKRPLQAGDIVNIDVSSKLNGFFGDASAMVIIGEISPEKRLVVDVSKECLMKSIEILKPGVLLSKIGDTIENIAHSKGCSVVEKFVGHGVGVKFHEEPQVLHSKNHIHIPLVEGMTFTIEPMINAGVADEIIDDDGWTARTLDGKASAQWEHTILITKDGYEILTQ